MNILKAIFWILVLKNLEYFVLTKLSFLIDELPQRINFIFIVLLTLVWRLHVNQNIFLRRLLVSCVLSENLENFLVHHDTLVQRILAHFHNLLKPWVRKLYLICSHKNDPLFQSLQHLLLFFLSFLDNCIFLNHFAHLCFLLEVDIDYRLVAVHVKWQTKQKYCTVYDHSSI